MGEGVGRLLVLRNCPLAACGTILVGGIFQESMHCRLSASIRITPASLSLSPSLPPALSHSIPRSFSFSPPPLSVFSVCSLWISLDLSVHAQSLTNENKELKVWHHKYEDLCESREQLPRHCHTLTCKYDEREREGEGEEKGRQQLGQHCRTLSTNTTPSCVNPCPDMHAGDAYQRCVA